MAERHLNPKLLPKPSYLRVGQGNAESRDVSSRKPRQVDQLQPHQDAGGKRKEGKDNVLPRDNDPPIRTRTAITAFGGDIYTLLHCERGWTSGFDLLRREKRLSQWQ